MLKRIQAGTFACLSFAALAGSGEVSARILLPGENLVTGQVMHSEDGRYLGTMQHDGNFVVYSNDGLQRPIWSTNTTGRGAVTAIMQYDGNFVLYDGVGRAIWWTGSNGRDRVLAITEYGQAMVLAPGRVARNTPGPGTTLYKQLGFKPVWSAREYDHVPGRLGNGPYCVGDPHACPKKLHGDLNQGP
ncbi:hypothetical protein J2T07_002844 [Luteibacter jiangsuensis]|uniref:Bulb-type lectin domain-containing protein n=1 Tax=Luteibacter jiangsuensis TaxID=637577 RepID=A0ABT9T047_9GAMM|nr:hypothetical protein [Luteibacter jiangsuensis]MDQ0010638.1 hypothetical protein [Luteibacter jiangsuensis]